MDLNHHRTGQGEPLVLIHGIGSQWQVWEPVIDRLAAEREVIALDLPGFGASPMPPPGTPAGVDSLTTLVTEFIAELGLERPHVAGNSLGGLIALELARRNAVRSTVAISPAGFGSESEMKLARVMLRTTMRITRLTSGGAEGLLATPRARKLMMGLFMAHPDRLAAWEAAESIRAFANAPWFEATLPTIRAHQFTGGEQITVPATVAWGDKDRLLLPRQARRAAAAIPQARIVPLPGCGHAPFIDDPELLTRVILEASRA